MKTNSVMWNQTPVVPSETGNEDHSDSGIDADDQSDRSSAVTEQNDADGQSDHSSTEHNNAVRKKNIWLLVKRV